jgi:hypothetical protein
MTVTKNVIADLLPLYEAGECSADTRALVEHYLKEHPEMRAEASVDKMLKAETPPRPEHEQRAALERTRSLLRLRTLLFGVAVFTNLTTFSFTFSSSEGITWLMWRDAPGTGFLLLAISAASWLAYFRVQKKLTVSGM